MYDYRVREVLRAVDGDTFDVRLSLGFGLTATLRVRLADADTHEVFGRHADSVRGPAARDFAAAWLEKRRGRLAMSSYRGSAATVGIGDGAFGRWLGSFRDTLTGEYLGDALAAAGHVKGVDVQEEE